MNERQKWLAEGLQRYLDRRSMPQGLKDKPQAQRDEMSALLHTLNRIAPSQGYRDWWDEFIDQLAEDAKTRAWPTQGEMKDAAKAIRKSGVRPVSSQSEWKPDSEEIAAKRIRAGESVGDDFLWGRRCLDMQERFGVTDEELKPYRSGLFFADKDSTQDEGIALKREQWRKEKHEAARQLRRANQERKRRDMPSFEIGGRA
jgi:hypothetical protein